MDEIRNQWPIAALVVGKLQRLAEASGPDANAVLILPVANGAGLQRATIAHAHDEDPAGEDGRTEDWNEKAPGHCSAAPVVSGRHERTGEAEMSTDQRFQRVPGRWGQAALVDQVVEAGHAALAFALASALPPGREAEVKLVLARKGSGRPGSGGR